jgi:hypothetical protein
VNENEFLSILLRGNVNKSILLKVAESIEGKE